MIGADYYWKNREERLAANKRYRQEHAAELAAKQFARRQANLTQQRERARAYYYRHREERLAAQREHRHRDPAAMRARSREAYRRRDPAAVAEYSRAYQQAHRERLTAHKRKYKNRNRDYINSRNRQKNRETPSRNNFKRWTEVEDKIALRTDISLLEKCFLLGRSSYAVRQRAAALRRQQKAS